jgi:hypothetical protein
MKDLASFQSTPQNNSVQFLAKCLSLVPIALALFLLSGFLALFSSATQAAPLEIIVLNIDTTLDSNATAYQACTSAPDDCTLRGAISVANMDSANAYTLNLPPGTYTITLSGRKEDNNATGDLDLKGTITLIGTDAVTTTINAAQRDRVLQVFSGSVVKLENLTLTNGLTADGVHGTFGMPGSAGGPGEPGGGLYNSGTLTITGSTLTNHRTGKGGGGGSTVSMCWGGSSAFNGLPGGDGGPGGAIYNQGTLTIQETTLQYNQTGNGEEGGAGGGLGTCIGDSGVSGDGGAGAGVYNALGSVLLVTSSTLDSNLTGAGQRFIDNTDLSIQTGGNGGFGGGFYNAGTLRLRNSTLSGNQTGDGGAGYYFDNARGGLAGIAGHGAGLYNTGTFSATHSTITNNSIGIEGDGKANPADGSGGGFYQASGAAEFRNTIIVGNSMPTSAAYADCYGALTSQNYNLVGSGTGCPSNGGQDQTTGDPRLSPLADNGGSTQTHALQPDSPARERIPPGSNGCQPGYSTDQRGAVRADGVNRGETRCDMGAYEYGSGENPNAVLLQGFSAHSMNLLAPDLPTIVLSIIALVVLSLLILVARFNWQSIKGAKKLRK